MNVEASALTHYNPDEFLHAPLDAALERLAEMRGVLSVLSGIHEQRTVEPEDVGRTADSLLRQLDYLDAYLEHLEELRPRLTITNGRRGAVAAPRGSRRRVRNG